MHTLSLAEVFTLRHQAFDEIRQHAFAIDAIAAAVADIDAALQVAIAVRNVDDQQALITSARQLSAAMAGRVA